MKRYIEIVSVVRKEWKQVRHQYMRGQMTIKKNAVSGFGLQK